MMKTKSYSSFLILILGMVVFSTVCSFSFPLARAATPVPLQISSKEAREVRVFLKTQRFGFYEKGNLVFWGAVCTGKKKHETPKGKFCVLEKFTIRKSLKWTRILRKDVFMPYALQFTDGKKGGHFLHVGEVLQRPSSDGCVRLCENDAKRIFHLVKRKDPVIITD
ncbi:MAG: L,D-transpeptidase [Candidatus Moraniibacteriota bacterium]